MVVAVAPNANADGWVVAVDPNENMFDVVLVAGVVVTGVAPKLNAPVLPPNGPVTGALVALFGPNVNGLAEAVVVGAVVVELLPNVNGLALVVVAAADAPNENIFLKYPILI